MKRNVLLLCVLLWPAAALAQNFATVIADAPIYIRAEVTPAPLRVAAIGTELRVLQTAGDWLQVEFNDPQFGLRVGGFAGARLAYQRLLHIGDKGIVRFPEKGGES